MTNISVKNKKYSLELKQKAEDFIKDRRNSNNLIDVLVKLESDNDDEVVAALLSLEMIFEHAVENDYFGTKVFSVANVEPAEQKYNLWLEEVYNDVKNRMVHMFQSPSEIVKEYALYTLMKFLSVEGKQQNRLLFQKKMKSPVQFLEDILSKLISTEYEMSFLCDLFQEFLQFDDIRYFSLKYLQYSIKQQKKKEIHDVYLSNILSLLQGITLPSNDKEDNYKNFILPEETANTEQMLFTINDTKKLFNSVWMDFLSFKLNSSQYKKVLVFLDDNVLPHLFNPLLLTDFLMDSYNIGGAVSLLALNSLFVLIQKYNLEYPEFYKKLYNLLEPRIFHVKYRSRFFHLADLFLSSTHLPEYLVAAFVKKMARLALSAPSNCLMFIIPFIRNLLVRHPNLFKLVHKTPITDFETDPYLQEEPDPLKSCALDSCLWELKILSEFHYLYGVSRSACIVDQPLPKTEVDVNDLLLTEVCEMMENETEKKIKFVPLTYEKPDGLMQCNWDQVSQFWMGGSLS